MRTIIILILIVVAIALVRMLVKDVVKAVGKSMSSANRADKAAPQDQRRAGGRLVKDPETGAYVDESSALQAEVDGTTYYFESEQSRDAFLRRRG